MKWYLVILRGAIPCTCVCPGCDESEAISFARREADQREDFKDVECVEVSAEESEKLTELTGVDCSGCDGNCEACYVDMHARGFCGISLAAQLDEWRGVVKDVATVDDPDAKPKGGKKSDK